MTTFPNSPRLTKGALIAIDPAGFSPLSTIVFQYNPENLTRTLQPQGVEGEGALYETERLKGAPIETIRLEAEFDATDRLEEGDETAEEYGVYRQLSALEMLVYPKTALVAANTTSLSLGMIEVIPPTGPLTFFVWNWQRILPVRLTELSITEEAFGRRLNPIRARVSLSLRVLSYNDFSWKHPGFTFFMAHQTIKETLAAMGTADNVENMAAEENRTILFSASI
ncbi:hypothetical protein Dvar_22500 [Desulfosarcina variabilis str. Montpellier]|uniref:hypothetical protein n=1 Tax=Desulfosarcina variabilis TaxID=2300 RepID=UPI003AFB5401